MMKITHTWVAHKSWKERKFPLVQFRHSASLDSAWWQEMCPLSHAPGEPSLLFALEKLFLTSASTSNNNQAKRSFILGRLPSIFGPNCLRVLWDLRCLSVLNLRSYVVTTFQHKKMIKLAIWPRSDDRGHQRAQAMDYRQSFTRKKDKSEVCASDLTLLVKLSLNDVH